MSAKHSGPWSPSKLACFEQCPRQAKYKFIDKMPDPGSAAMQRGNQIHDAIEGYISNRSNKFPEEAKGVKPLLQILRKEYKERRVRVELNLGFDKDWKLLPDWFSKDTWLRVKMDAAHIVYPLVKVYDWKTGRFKPEDPAYNDQLNIYAVASLSAGWAEQTEAALVFTDHGEMVERPVAGKLKLKDLKAAQGVWNKRVKKFYVESKHAPRPGPYCRWCPFSLNKEGPCDF